MNRFNNCDIHFSISKQWIAFYYYFLRCKSWDKMQESCYEQLFINTKFLWVTSRLNYCLSYELRH